MIRDNLAGPFLDSGAGTRVEQALMLLAQAQAYAADTGASPWEFAVELDCLEKEGLKSTDLRWLLAKGYLHHGTKLSRMDRLNRQVEVSESLSFTAQSCFIISAAGERLFQPNGHAPVLHHSPAVPPMRPQWDDERQELRIGELLVKKFKLPAPNQRRVLTAFEEETWPFRIDDPLPNHSDIDSKRRLHHTLIALNRNQKCQAIRFLGDGSGEGVCWELIESRAL